MQFFSLKNTSIFLIIIPNSIAKPSNFWMQKGENSKKSGMWCLLKNYHLILAFISSNKGPVLLRGTLTTP